MITQVVAITTLASTSTCWTRLVIVTRVRLERFSWNFATPTASRAAVVPWLVNELVILPVGFIAMRALIYISVVIQKHVVNVATAMT